MPTSWWGRILMWGYVGGYFLYWLAAAVSAWPHLTLMQWWSYIGFQAVYAVFWPILVLLTAIGFRW